MFPERKRGVTRLCRFQSRTVRWATSVEKNLAGAMFPRISRNSKRIIAVLSKNRLPRQIAWGVAIGVIIGLIPKDNLLTALLIVMIACLRVNQLVSCITAVFVHLLSGMLGSISSLIGSSLLAQPFVIRSIVFLYQFPLIPWTCLENALVLGGIVLGLITLLPTYVICLWSLSKARNQLEHIALEQVADNAIEYRKLVAMQSNKRHEKQPPMLRLIDENTRLAPAAQMESPKSTPVKMNMPAIKESQSTSQDKKGTFRRTERKIQQRVIPTIFTGETNWDGSDTLLRETVIEVVRYRRPNPAENLKDTNNQLSPASSSTQGNSMPTGNASAVDAKQTNSIAYPAVSKVAEVSPSISFDPGHVLGQTNSRDESLRYLLWHINGSRENGRKSSEKTA